VSVFTTTHTQQQQVNTYKQPSDINSNKRLSCRTIHSIACLFCNRFYSLLHNAPSTALCILGGGAFQPTERPTNKRKRFPFSTKIFFSLFYIPILYRTYCMMLKLQHTSLLNRCILLFKRCLSTTKTNIFTTKTCLSATKRYIIWYKRCFFLFKRCLSTTKTNIFTTKTCLSATKRYIIWYKRCFFLFKRCLSTTKTNIFTTKTCLSATKRYIIWYKRCFFLFKRCLSTTKTNIFTTKTCLSATKRYIIWYKRCFFLFKRCLSTTKTNIFTTKSCLSTTKRYIIWYKRCLSATHSYPTYRQSYSYSSPLQRRLNNRLTKLRSNITNEQPIINHITNSLQFSLFSF